MDAKLLDILVCPATKAPLVYDRSRQELLSQAAGLAYPIRDGIPIMLEDEARWAIKQRFVQKAELPNFLGFIYLDAMAAVKPEALTIIH